MSALISRLLSISKHIQIYLPLLLFISCDTVFSKVTTSFYIQILFRSFECNVYEQKPSSNSSFLCIIPYRIKQFIPLKYIQLKMHNFIPQKLAILWYFAQVSLKAVLNLNNVAQHNIRNILPGWKIHPFRLYIIFTYNFVLCHVWKYHNG